MAAESVADDSLKNKKEKLKQCESVADDSLENNKKEKLKQWISSAPTSEALLLRLSAEVPVEPLRTLLLARLPELTDDAIDFYWDRAQPPFTKILYMDLLRKVVIFTDRAENAAVCTDFEMAHCLNEIKTARDLMGPSLATRRYLLWSQTRRHLTNSERLSGYKGIITKLTSTAHSRSTGRSVVIIRPGKYTFRRHLLLTTKNLHHNLFTFVGLDVTRTRIVFENRLCVMSSVCFMNVTLHLRDSMRITSQNARCHFKRCHVKFSRRPIQLLKNGELVMVDCNLLNKRKRGSFKLSAIAANVWAGTLQIENCTFTDFTSCIRFVGSETPQSRLSFQVHAPSTFVNLTNTPLL